MVLALLLVALLGVLGLFQLALALGAPWGQLAWGGASGTVLPHNQRIASGLVVVVLLVMSLFILDLAGLVQFVPNVVAQVVAWLTFAAFLVSACLNLLSQTRIERLVMAPVAGLYALVAFFVALAGPVPSHYFGAVIADSAATMWCETVLESYPPQCGGDTPTIADWDWDQVPHESYEGVNWGTYEFDAIRDGDTLHLTGDITPVR